MQIFRNKTCANALNRVRRGGAARDDGRSLGLYRKHLQLRPFLFQDLRATGEVSTCAHTRDDRIQAFREVGQNFQSGGTYMHCDVSGVLKLLGHPSAGCCIHQLLGSGDGALHALFARR